MTRGERGGSHPTAAELERFMLGEMSPQQAAPLIAHLVRGCELCRQQMAPFTSVMFAAGPIVPDLEPISDSQYDFPLFKAFAAARRYDLSFRQAESELRQDPGQALAEVPSFESSGPERPLQDSRVRCEALLEWCRSLRYHDPEGMVLASRLAVSLAERTAGSHGRPEELIDLQVKAWAELGNAYRVADELTSAEAALGRALALSGLGTGDPLLLARLMDLTASLYTDQRRFMEAHQLLDCVFTIYQHLGETHAAARALVSKGISLGYAFESEEAVRLLAEGIRQIDAARDPKLMLAAIHGLLWCLVDCGRVPQVAGLLDQVRDLYAFHGERFDELRARWLEGRIAAGLGEAAKAEEAFLSVREGFKQAEQLYDTALVSLDLAALWLSQGRTAEILGLIDEMVAIFRAHDIRRETFGALLMVQEALREDQATVALFRAVAGEFWRMERFPGRKNRSSD